MSSNVQTTTVEYKPVCTSCNHVFDRLDVLMLPNDPLPSTAVFTPPKCPKCGKYIKEFNVDLTPFYPNKEL